MAESLTPAGCGGRRWQWLGIALFTVAAIAAGAAVGATVGWGGSLLPSRTVALIVGAAVVAIAAAREAEIIRFPVPAVRRQVPEHWRRVLPVPVWTSGYGAILGSGLGTYHPVATFWAVLAAILTVGDPLVGAVGLAAFGVGRGVMAAGSLRLFDLVASRGQRALRIANALVLTVLAVVLAATPATGQTGAPSPTGGADPTISQGVRAFTDYRAGQPPRVTIVPPTGRRIVLTGVREPSLSGDRIAVVTEVGIDVRRWATDEVVATVPGRLVHPALSGPWLSYVELVPRGSRVILRHLPSGRVRVLTKKGPGVDIGRPSISGPLVVWHETSGRGSRILSRRVTGGPVRILVATARRWQASAPSIANGVLVWVDSDIETFWVRARRLSGGRTVTLMRTPHKIVVSTATDGTRAWVGSWHGFAGRGRVRMVRIPAAVARR